MFSFQSRNPTFRFRLTLQQGCMYLALFEWNTQDPIKQSFESRLKIQRKNLSDSDDVMAGVSYSDFNGRGGVHTVLVIKIDVVHIKPLQACLTSWPHIFGVTSHLDSIILGDREPKFGCNLHLVSSAFYGLQINEGGEPAASYRWTGWVWEIASWSSRLWENYWSM